MDNNFTILAFTAANIAFFHTLLGPDHYLPFVVMSRARNWSVKRTVVLTSLCGFGHVASSIVLGFVGIALGTAVSKLEAIEAYRGNIAAWLFITFGFVYMVWGIKQAIKGVTHSHSHSHSISCFGNDNETSSHNHSHSHSEDHVHAHDEAENTDNKATTSITPWILFTIFVFGPCEPLIPILMYPAAKGHIVDVIGVALIFGFITISTMLAVVLLSIYGFSSVKLKKLEKYSHAIAGGTICASGMAIQFLGL